MMIGGDRKSLITYLITKKIARRFHDVCAQQLINIDKGDFEVASHWGIRRDELLSMASDCFGISRDELIKASGFPMSRLHGWDHLLLDPTEKY